MQLLQSDSSLGSDYRKLSEWGECGEKERRTAWAAEVEI